MSALAATKAPALTKDDLNARLAAFLGQRPAQIETLAGDASTRRYHRVTVPGRTLVVMELPEDARGDGDSARFPFLNVRSYLHAVGLPVPDVFGVDLRAGFIALEDLGDTTFEQSLRSRDARGRAALYRRAIDLIVALQSAGRERMDPDCVAFGRAFDFTLLRWELDHFREWLLEVDRGVRLPEEDARALADAFDGLARGLAESPRVLVHRDFQSRNLMVPAANDDRLVVIDFQDALQGTVVYDLVALLRDSYVELDDGEVDEHLAYYAERAGVADRVALRGLFDRQTLQRKLKDAGRFVFIDRVRGNPTFLRWIPTSLKYVRDALRRADVGPAGEILRRHLPELR